MTLLTLLPFLVFIVLLLSKSRLLSAAWVFWSLTATLVLSVWKMDPGVFLGATTKGMQTALEIFLIIAGALFFLKVTQITNTLSSLTKLLSGLSANRGIQVVLLSWFLLGFLEGTAGFGTPVAVVAPILISLGISPLTAVAITMLGNSAPGAFGAAGTPIKIGLSGLDLTGVNETVATINLAGFFIPLVMVWLSERKFTRQTFAFALFSGVSFLGFSKLAVTLGGEMPSIIGPLAGILLSGLLLKLGVFGNKENRQPPLIKAQVFYTVFPYLLLIGLLLLIRFGLKLTGFWSNPGFVFVISGAITGWFFRKKAYGKLLFSSTQKAFESLVIIFPLASATQLMLRSSFFDPLMNIFAKLSISFVSPFLGALGAFVTGSATVANLMFGHLVNQVAVSQGISTVLALSLLVVGSAAGNMIALADILPALIITDQPNKEMAVVKKVIKYCLLYILMALILGLVVFS